DAIAAIAGDREEVRAYSARLETALAANEEHRRDLEARLHQRKRDRVHPRGRAAPRMPDGVLRVARWARALARAVRDR
ncbi:MAG: hypothetical protein ACYDAR_19135, partial [Thermomicrobiales bacterium]